VGPKAFGQKTRQKIILDPKRSIRLVFEGERMTGERTITLAPLKGDETKVEVVWNLEPEGVPGFVEGIMRGQIDKATEEALRKVGEAAEGLP